MKFEKKDRRTMLQKEIAEIERQMSEIQDKTCEKYLKLQETWTTACEVENRINEIKASGKKAVDPNALITVAGGLLEIILIMNHERLYVIATKAWSRVLRGRI